MNDLVPGLPFVLEEVLDHTEQLSAVHRNIEFLAELAAKRGFCGLSKLDATTNRTMKVHAFDVIGTIEQENVIGADMKSHSDVSN